MQDDPPSLTSNPIALNARTLDGTIENQPSLEEISQCRNFLSATNSKVLYRRSQLIEITIGVNELHTFLVDELYFDENDECNAMVLVLGRYNGDVDDNIFAYILIYLQKKELGFKDIALLNEIALLRCFQSEKQYWTQSLVCQNKNYIYERCSKCRGKTFNVMKDHSTL